VPLDDADQAKLDEIERRLREDPQLSATFATRPRSPLALPVTTAAAVFLAALTALSVLTTSPLPLLLGILPATAAVLAVRRRPRVRRERVRPVVEPGNGGPTASGPLEPWWFA
jgi:Protein of unknown function (DUF3040)